MNNSQKKNYNFALDATQEIWSPDHISSDESLGPMDEEDKAFVGMYIQKMVSETVKKYCEEHFEEIIAAAIMLHEAKKKRKIVKAAVKLEKKTENK